MNRNLDRAALHAALDDTRQRLLAIYAGLPEALWQAVPYLKIINPPRWEAGHVAWFNERWCLRRIDDDRFRPSHFLADADRWFNSGTVAHSTRWTLDLPDTQGIRDYLAATLAACHEALERADASLYHFQLSLYHEDMHCEAFHYTLQTLGQPLPAGLPVGPPANSGAMQLEHPGGRVTVGSPRDAPFVFDNEKWQHERSLAPFAIDAEPVSNARFLAFVEDGGYAHEEFWSATGRQWLQESGRAAPRTWRRAEDGRWQRGAFGRWQALEDDEPVLHVTAFEAEAWCRWAGRRLPAESEWEAAARQFGERFHPWGQVWQWTASAFEPYAGFAPDAYRDYSRLWFHSHRSVRGGSFATPQRLLHPAFRNFYQPHRDDIFVGFRSARSL